jgi:hypothetical protein
MTTEILKDFFMWCSILNIAFLTFSWLVFWLRRDWIYRMHTRWFKISDQQFNALWYGLLGFYKISIFLFNVVPFIALTIAA